MASQTPFHLERIFLVNRGHIIDLSVTGRAAYALCNVNTVIKVSIFRKIVNAFPLDRFVLTPACLDRLEIRAIVPYLAMAVHTGLGRRHSGRRCRLDRLVAITTIDAIVAYVVLMAKLHWLLLFDIPSGHVRRTRDLRKRETTDASQHDDHDHADLGNIICTFWKDLSHLLYADRPLRYRFVYRN